MENDCIIKVENLVKKFDDLTAVDGVDFCVKEGDIFAFLGPNGAGKSTSIKLLTTLLRPTSGKITLNGYDVLKQQGKARESFGIVFQDFSLDDELTARENMLFHAALYKIPRKEANAKVSDLLDFMGLKERENEVVKKFSGGMKRRLEIARGLLHHPKILFLDEPTLGLDPQTRTQIWEHIMKLNNDKKMTVFLTTHYIEEAEKMADKVAIIDHGGIIICGSSEEIKRSVGAESLEKAFLKLTGREIRD
jgi:ABC-2 type transport system ATP-binding protein